MALSHELDEFDKNVKKHEQNVARVETQKVQALSRAQAQLAILATQESLRSEPIDVTLRKDFNADSPETVLNVDELKSFDGAKLVIDAIGQHVTASERLAAQQEPYYTSPGLV